MVTVGTVIAQASPLAAMRVRNEPAIMLVISPIASAMPSRSISFSGMPEHRRGDVARRVERAVERDQTIGGSGKAHRADHVRVRSESVAFDGDLVGELPEHHGLEDLFGDLDQRLDHGCRGDRHGS